MKINASTFIWSNNMKSLLTKLNRLLSSNDGQHNSSAVLECKFKDNYYGDQLCRS